MLGCYEKEKKKVSSKTGGRGVNCCAGKSYERGSNHAARGSKVVLHLASVGAGQKTKKRVGGGAEQRARHSDLRREHDRESHSVTNHSFTRRWATEVGWGGGKPPSEPRKSSRISPRVKIVIQQGKRRGHCTGPL